MFTSIVVCSCSDNDSDVTTSGTTSDSQTQVEGKGGSLATFTLKGNYLYVVDEFDLNVFSLLNGGIPVLVNKVPVGFDIETLFGYKEYLYIGSRNGMFIYDLVNPESPNQLSRVEHFTACDPVVANDSLAFVSLHSNTMCGNDINVVHVYDVKNTTEPILISTRNLVSPKGMGLYGDYLIVCDDEIKIFDVTVPDSSRLVNAINREAFDVIIRNDHMFAVGEHGVYQYQLSKNDEGVSYTELSTLSI